jgi:riboflavin kinase/FMN adenylyltransferase
MLGYDYFVSGRVEKGKGIGKELGFPTANIAIDEDKLLPAEGAYAGYICLKGKYHPASVNIGSNPTIDKEGQNKFSFEVHIKGYKGDLYGENIRIHLIKRIRDEKKFASLKELREAIGKDVSTTEKMFLTHNKRCIPL